MGFTPSSINSAYALAMLANAAQAPAKAAWETKFAQWRQPPSEIEKEKIERTLRMIREAIAASNELKGVLDVRLQGSFYNNTNVPGESDVDVRLMYNNRFQYNVNNAVPGIVHNRQITPYTGPSDIDLKASIYGALEAKFGKDTIRFTGKCFKIRASTARVDADVILAYPYYELFPSAGYIAAGTSPRVEGIALFDGDMMIVNWPEQHYANGVDKNKRTGTRYKAVVRAMKSFNLERQTSLRSFFVEGLVYNCDDACFSHDSLYDNVQSVCARIIGFDVMPAAASDWTEPNGIKSLFVGDGRTVQDAVALARYAQAQMSKA